MSSSVKKDKRRHFKDKNFAEQAKTINSDIINLKKSILHHVRLAKSEKRNHYEILLTFIGQLSRMIDRLLKEIKRI